MYIKGTEKEFTTTSFLKKMFQEEGGQGLELGRSLFIV